MLVNLTFQKQNNILLSEMHITVFNANNRAWTKTTGKINSHTIKRFF